MGYSRRKPNKGGERGGVDDEILKKEHVEIPGVNLRRGGFSRSVQKKAHVEFLWVLVFDREISKECHTILQNFQGRKLVFYRISQGKS